MGSPKRTPNEAGSDKVHGQDVPDLTNASAQASSFLEPGVIALIAFTAAAVGCVLIYFTVF